MQHRVLLHEQGPALWPEHKPVEEVLGLKATTPEGIWEATYQGNPTPPGGSVFRRSWWRGQNRYEAGDKAVINRVVGRWLSWDTALKEKEESAYTAVTVGEMMPEYVLVIREVWRERLPFPDLPEVMEEKATLYNRDEKLRGVVIEDKASGTSAYQTLMATAEDWLRPFLVAFMPVGDKRQRAEQAAVWCKNGCIWLPKPGELTPWLLDFEDELFGFPGSIFSDQVDSFSQLIIYLEHYLAMGWGNR